MKQEFFAKAEENLKATALLLEQGLYNAAANRAYYATFQAAVAALLHVGISLEIGDRISHQAVHSSFATELIQRRKIYPGHFKSYLIELQVVRNKADYRAESLSKSLASQQVKRAQELVASVRRKISL